MLGFPAPYPQYGSFFDEVVMSSFASPARLRIALPFAGSLALAVLSVGLAEGAIIAQGYWQETKSESCNFAICYMTFSKVPVGKTIILSNASCKFLISGSGPIRHVDLGAKTSTGATSPVHSFLKIVFNGQVGNLRHYTVNEEITHILRAGEEASVTFTVDNVVGMSATCNLSGRILP